MFTCDRCGREISEDEIASQPSLDHGSQTFCESCAGQKPGKMYKRDQPVRLLNLILLILVAILIATGWFFLFYGTGYPWDILSVLAGWGIGRLYTHQYAWRDLISNGCSRDLAHPVDHCRARISYPKSGRQLYIGSESSRGQIRIPPPDLLPNGTT